MQPFAVAGAGIDCEYPVPGSPTDSPLAKRKGIAGNVWPGLWLRGLLGSAPQHRKPRDHQDADNQVAKTFLTDPVPDALAGQQTEGDR